jgi:hypothetical protein
MSLSRILLMALTLMGPAVAAPLAKRVQPNAQTCSSAYKFFFSSYDVLIGIPWDDTLCNPTLNNLIDGAGTDSASDSNTDFGIWVTNWHCAEEYGYVHLWFHTPVGDADSVNAALEYTYPQINGGFNC